MICARWICWTWIAACLAATAPPVRAQGPATAPAGTDPAAARAVLEDAGARMDDKEQAARRLLTAHSPAAMKALRDELADGSDQAGRIAVARALAGATTPADEADFLDPLLAMMRDNLKAMANTGAAKPVPIDAAPDAARALCAYRFDPRVREAVFKFVDNNNYPERARMGVVRATGNLVQKAAARDIVETFLREDRNENEAFRDACCDALGEMSGIARLEHDVPQWRAWWDANKARSDAAWADEVLRRQSEQGVREQRELKGLLEAVENALNAAWAAVPKEMPEARKDLALGWLRDPDPLLRGVAIDVVRQSTDHPPDEIVAQVRGMIFDPSAWVRERAAHELYKLNDKKSLASLLSQLQQEDNPDVLAEIARALSFVGDRDAVAPLLRLLDDPLQRVVQRAVEALGELGETVRADPNLLDRVSKELRRVKVERTDTVAAPGLRKEVAKAMGKMHNPNLLVDLKLLASSGNVLNDIGVRVEAVSALGGLPDDRVRAAAADALADCLDRDPEASVRLKAAEQLCNLKSFAQAEIISKHVLPANEPDAPVRAKCAEALLASFSDPGATPEQIRLFLPRLNAEQRRDALLVMGRKYQTEAANAVDADLKQKLNEQLADTREETGDAYTELKDHENAAIHYDLALTFWLHAPNPQPGIINGLVRKRLEALLLARKYKEAVDFGATCIAGGDKLMEETVNTGIVAHIQRLYDDKQFDDALQLIDAALGAKPALKLAPQIENLRPKVETEKKRAAPAGDASN